MKDIGKKFADMFYSIGNSLNLCNSRHHSKNRFKYDRSKFKYESDDKKAIEEVWKEVGKDLESVMYKKNR